jgi:hypothetical protein
VDVNTPPMSREAADQILAGLGAANDRVAAAMFAIDSQPALGFLRSSTLTGATAARWRTLRPEVDLLWAHFTFLGGVLEQARTDRGGRRPDDPQWTELTKLLRDPTIGLDAAGLPADGSAAPPVAWVRLWDLAQQLEARCASVAGHLSEVDAAWSAVANRLATITEAVDAASALAADLGVAATVKPLRQRLATIHDADLSDPLTTAPAGRLAATADARLRELGVAVAEARQRLGEMTRLRDGYPQRIAALRGLAEEVRVAERAVADAYARAIAKVAQPGLPRAHRGGFVLLPTPAELERLGRDGRWGDLADALTTAERSAYQARDRAGQLREVADGLVARRDELRGRLDAYRAKASAKGLGEHGELTARYDDAHALLFTAPCDLRAATRAVRAYQQTLASLLEEPAS